MKRGPIFAVAAMAAMSASAVLRLAGPFTDGAVLQRGMKVPVWGWADPGEEVSVSFAGQTKSAKADEKGAWRVDLDPLETSCEGRDLVISSNRTIEQSNNPTILHDVLVGEVWFVSGQSNCELPLCGAPHSGDRNGHAVAQKTRLPLVRFCRPDASRIEATPQDMPSRPVKWLPFLPENLLGHGRSFSAIGFYFGLELHNALRIPVGLIGAYWGGTCIDPWIPKTGYEGHPDLKDIAEWPTSMTWDGKSPKSLWTHSRVRDQPSVIWNAMVNPWCPYAMRGFIWYQGEANSRQPERYASQMHALYDGWAKRFENPDLKLYFVQLAPWGFEGIARIQEAQAQFEREEPHAGMAVVNDLGNLDDIHPNEKGTVGLRLALHALKRDYGFGDIQDNSPTLRDWRIEGDTFVLSFDNAKSLYMYTRDFSIDTPFEIAGADGVFKPARIANLKPGTEGRRPKGGIEGTELRVRAEGVEKPVGLRYLHSRPWTGTVYNEADLPLGAFHIGEFTEASGNAP